MANERFTADNTHIALATGDDAGGGSGLTAWRNADAAFIAGELQPTDQFIGGSFKFPKPKTQEVGALKATYIADRREAGREKGSLNLDFALQTAQFCWWLWQACTTRCLLKILTGHLIMVSVGTPAMPTMQGCSQSSLLMMASDLNINPLRLVVDTTSNGGHRGTN